MKTIVPEPIESFEVRRLRELEIEIPKIAEAMDAKRREIIETSVKLHQELDQLMARWHAAQRERGDLI